MLRGPNAGPTCAQHVHPCAKPLALPCRQASFSSLIPPYVLANVWEAVPEPISLPSKFELPNPKKSATCPCPAMPTLHVSVFVSLPIRPIRPKSPVAEVVQRPAVRVFVSCGQFGRFGPLSSPGRQRPPRGAMRRRWRFWTQKGARAAAPSSLRAGRPASGSAPRHVNAPYGFEAHALAVRAGRAALDRSGAAAPRCHSGANANAPWRDEVKR